MINHSNVMSIWVYRGLQNFVEKGTIVALLSAAAISPAVAQYAAGGTPNSTSGGTTAAANSTAIGAGSTFNANAGGSESVAVGPGAITINDKDIAIGRSAVAKGLQYCRPNNPKDCPVGAVGFAVAIGGFSRAEGNGAISLGSTVYGRLSVGLGGATIGAVDKPSEQSVAIGQGARAGTSLNIWPSGVNYSNSIAIGTGSNAVFDATAIGASSVAFGDHSIALGVRARVGDVFDLVTGQPTEQSLAAPSAVAIGNLAQAKRDNSIAIGPNSEVSDIGSVSLGAFSASSQSISTPNVTISGTTYPFAGTAESTVSIGRSTASNGLPVYHRTITNVAAGRVSKSSTDAINGSQLDAVILALIALRAEFEAYKAAHP